MEVTKKKSCATLVLVLTIAVMFLQVSNAYPTEFSLEEKALSVITNVARLDTIKYDIKLTKHVTDEYGGIARESLTFTLESAGSTLEIACDFINGTLVSFVLYPLYSQLSQFCVQPLPATSLDAVRGFLQRYQAYSKASVAQEALGVLDRVSELKTVNITVGNLKMRVEGNNIDWLRIVNGLEFPTGLSIRLNNGIVDAFMDESSFYRIGSADVNISREEAVRIALERAKTITTLTIWVGDRWETFPFRVKEEPLIVRLQVGTANFTSYPYWYVWFVADPQVYSTTGVEVCLRADTGEIAYSQTTRSYGVVPDPDAPSAATPNPSASPDTQPESDTDQPIAAYVIAGAAATAIAVAVAAAALKKRRKWPSFPHFSF